jgi:V8-like Glu-specific endopeptidase
VAALTASVAALALPASAIGASRIVNGGSTVTTAGAWPWAVLVVVNGSSVCSGALIGPTTALTAAHCADPNIVGPSPSFVVSNARNINDTSNSNSSSVTSSAVDPQWDSNNIQNGHDFAVLTLASALPGADYLPVLQPSQVSPFQTSFNGLVAGYGLTNAGNPNSSGVLNQTEVQGASYPSNAALITDGATPAYTCEGDSGAPLITSQTGSTLPVTSDPMPSNGHWAVIGVVSFGNGGCSGLDGFAAAAADSSFLLPNEIPVNYVRPAITGTPRAGKKLSCSNGTWSTTITPTYQWDTIGTGGAGIPIAGAHGQTFTPGRAQVGKRLECIVTASAQGFGAPNHTASAPTPSVAQARPTLSATAPSTGTAGRRIFASSLSAVLAAGVAPTGKITFTVFGPQATAPTSCSSGGKIVGSATVSGNRTYHPAADFTPTKAGTYWWYAHYLGDVANAIASSRCGTLMAKTAVSR